MTTICLAIPHTPWVEARVASLKALKRALHIDADKDDRDAHMPRAYGLTRVEYLTDRAPNEVWSVDMWRWMLDTGADFCLTLQDDVIVAPCFWPALRAMLAKVPKGHVLGLSGVHPHARELARRGHRWYRTTAWVIGWAYGWWREDLARFLDWRLSKEGEDVCKAILPNGEDALQNSWIPRAGLDVWHPVPTIVDHDVSLESTYDNDDHGHRRPWVTWRSYDERELTDPDFWLVHGKAPKHLWTVPQHLCSFCAKRAPMFRAQETGASLCGPCLHGLVGEGLRRLT